MKRLLLLLVFFVCGGEALAFPLPPALETAHLLGSGLSSGPPPVALTDELTALGWSRNNAFAFLERRTLPSGTREVRLRVVDLVEDQVLFEEIWTDWGEEGEKLSWWQARETQVEALFRRLSLTPTNWQLGVFPLILDNEYYTPVLRKTFDSREPGWIRNLEILVHSTGRGLKSVQTVAGYWRWASLLGFIPSPYENRVALVLLVQPAGWGGANQPLRFLVTGMSLKAGFPKP